MEDTKPLFAAVYGPAGTGKTLASIRMSPHGLMLGPRGAAACGSFIGWDVGANAYAFREIYTIKDAAEYIEANLSKLEKAKIPSLVISDVSILADNEIARIKLPKKDGGEGKTNWDVQTAFIDNIRELRDWCRTRCPFPIFWEFHVTNPRTVKDAKGNEKNIPGGLSVPGWNVPEKLPGIFDAVLRVVHDDTVNPLWPWVYSVEPDEFFVTKDRFNVFPRKAPLNLREALSMRGFSFPFREDKGLGWMESVIEHVATGVLALNTADEAYKKNLQEVLTGSIEFAKKAQTEAGQVLNLHRVRWALYDGLDRAYLRKHDAGILDDFVSRMTA
jgi:hypothetical protein